VLQERVVIVGAGIVGLSTAYALLREGKHLVTVLEQETVDHKRATSHGISRLLRFEYGADALYSEMVRLSLQRWKQLERSSRHTLYTQTGLLVLGTENDNFALPSYQVMQNLDLPSEHLSRHHCTQRFPQFKLHATDVLTYNAQGGILYASQCLQTLRDLIVEMGGNIYESCRVTQIDSESQNHPLRIFCSTGNGSTSHEFVADRVVLATGPWVHRLLTDLHLPVRLTRQYLLYFAGLPFSSFGIQAFPAFITNDLYGFPMHSMSDVADGSVTLLKAASHAFGTPIDPNDIQPPDELVVVQIARRLRDLLPALQQAQLAHVDACMYDVTPDEDFILDCLPYNPRVIFATGLSGHGFKFGLLLGEMLSSMICETTPPVALERFRLSRFAQSLQQQKISAA
jgi:monomeric sarcosine oxidase